MILQQVSCDMSGPKSSQEYSPPWESPELKKGHNPHVKLTTTVVFAATKCHKMVFNLIFHVMFRSTIGI